MEIDYEPFQIPTEFADYTRRLIIYSEPGIMLARFADLFDELKKFGALDKRMEFSVGNIAVKVVYLSDERITVAEVIADVHLRFAMFHFEGDARMGLAALAPPNDQLYPRQWALHQIEAAAAWDRVAEVMPARPAVTVAIIDSGIQRNHQDLAGASITGLRLIPPLSGTFADDTGHGTMIAGIIGAVADNTTGMAGGARNVDILALKITDERTPPTALAAMSAIGLAVFNEFKIINASWHVLGGTGLRDVIVEAGLKGCVVVIAAGNYGSDNTKIPTLPASYGLPDTVVVMASDRHDVKCWFSNYGATVDLAAPGLRVQSTGIYYINPRYPDHSGTSVAAAHVSAAAALLLAIDDWTPNEIRDHLNASADRPRSLHGLSRSEGRLNLRRAVCGPFKIVNPVGGGPLTQGSSLNVQWTLDYVAPVVNTVEISFINEASGAVLSKFIGASRNGPQAVTVPSLPTKAFIRVKCEQRNLYTDSAAFDIV